MKAAVNSLKVHLYNEGKQMQKYEGRYTWKLYQD